MRTGAFCFFQLFSEKRTQEPSPERVRSERGREDKPLTPVLYSTREGGELYGAIFFRQDTQVKVRGHRIELGEAENVLLTHELMVFLYHFIWIAIEMLLGYTIMSIVKGNDYANFELLCSIICKIIMLALVKIIPLVIDPSIECDMPSKYCFMLTVLPVISTVVVYNIFLITSRIDRLELIAFSTVSSTLILALNLLVYDIYIKLLEQTEIRRENAIYEKQISLFQEQIYVKETAMLNDKMVRDKFYHQLSFIKELVYQRELSQLNEFIDGIMQNKKIEKDGPANSGNVLLDYIVNNKCEIAVKQGIECTVKIEVPYKFPFSDGDIFIILGNALDNAIEGALKCVSRRYIHIKIIYRKENLFIKISNSFDGKVKKDRHGHLISMKSDLTRYGLGLALIEKSVKLHVLNMKADDYIEKPINIDELEEKMLQLLHKLS